jgi:hypothetical protein
MSLPDDTDRRARMLRRAMRHPTVYLAAALAEIPDEDLAAEISADPARVWQLRLCEWPRDNNWATDLRQMAALVGGDAHRLARLLLEVDERPGTRRPPV